MAGGIKQDSIIALADIELGWVYSKKGLLDSSDYYYNHALAVYENTGDTLGIGIAMHNLSTFYRSKTDFEKSLKYALESNRILKKSEKKLLYCRSLLTLGNIYHDIREFDTALSCFEMCQSLSLEQQNERLNIKSTINKGATYLSLGKDEQAKDELLKALDICKKVKYYKDLSLIYQLVSIAYKRLDQPEASLVFSKEALDLAREVGDKELEIHALTNLGVIHKQVGDLKKAEMYYLEGIQMAEQYHFLFDMRRAYGNIALFYEAAHNYPKAYDYLNKYVAINDSIVDVEKTDAREKYKAEYELLHYKDLNHIKELEKHKIRHQRNLSYGIGAALVIMLLVVVFFLRMRARKNRIIAAQKIQKLEDEKKLMAARAVLVGQEKERERIARELHDGIGVLLSTASIHFSSVEGKVDDRTGELLQKANKLLKEAGQEVRQISHNMMPGVLSKFGLREAIEDMFEDVQESGKIEVDLNIVCPNDDRLAENMEIMIYRIVQEMLNNTIKYAGASLIRFNIVRSEDLIEIEFSDNGIGFEEDKLPHDKNLGLSGIRSRVEYLGGSIDLYSEPGKGTAYKVTVPLREKIK
jgi:signal transduction histidine kinase